MKKKEQRFIESRLPTKNKEALFSHKSDLWKTPKNLYDAYMRMGYFDPCPTNPKFDGLNIEWKERNFVNPPYSQINKWVDKAIIEAWKGNFTVLLVPARTDTKWFKKLWKHGVLVKFIIGRLHFNDEKKSAPFPSMLVSVNTNGFTESEATILDRRELR